jgi:hypothetical protein
MHRIFPLQQGHLDGLCGVYSIVNATRKAKGKLAHEESKALFLEVIRHLQEKKEGLHFLVEGISIHDIGTALRDVVAPTHGITRSKPYDKNPSLGLNILWQTMTEYLEEPNRAIIIGLGGKHDHWTVVDSITDKRLTLLDSDELYHINRCACTTTDRITARRRHRIMPTHAYFIEG